jgi:DNA replication protein DnaC
MKRLSEVMKETGVDSSKENTPTISSISEPSSKDCPLCGGLGYVRENVPVGHPNFGKLFPCRCKLVEIEQQRRERLRTLSNLDHLARMTFESFVPEGLGLLPDKAANLSLAFDLARQYAASPQGWFVLFGGYGCGKTHLAAAIANQAIERGLSVLFVVVPDLLDHLRATYSPSSAVGYDERFAEVRNAPLLILDDLGTQSSTPWAQEKLFQILNYRYNAQLPTVITSNHSLDEIDPRIRSRLEDRALSRFLRIEAPDYRQRDVDQSQSVLSSLELMKDMTFASFSLREDELPPDERANLKRAFDTCWQYAEFPQGWLALTGVYGCGKTHLAAAIANACVASGEPALFVVVPDLLDHLRATFNPNSQVRFDKRFDEVRTAPLLVLDDLGTESASPWAREKLYQLFNYRYNARLPTVITMAQSMEEVDPRLRTRMLDRERCTVYGIIVPGFRGSAKRQTSAEKKPRSHRSKR